MSIKIGNWWLADSLCEYTKFYLSIVGVFRLSGSETAFSISLRTSALSPSPLAVFSKARIISLESSDSLYALPAMSPWKYLVNGSVPISPFSE